MGLARLIFDVKPEYQGVDFAREMALRKIRSRVEGVRIASEKLGI